MALSPTLRDILVPTSPLRLLSRLSRPRIRLEHGKFGDGCGVGRGGNTGESDQQDHYRKVLHMLME